MDDRSNARAPQAEPAEASTARAVGFDSDVGLWFEDTNGDGKADVSAAASLDEVQDSFYDTDRGVWLIDSDQDGVVDLSEVMAGADPTSKTSVPPGNHNAHLDADSIPSYPQKGETEAYVGFPTSSCRTNFRQAGSRLCIDSDEQGATRYDYASEYCRERYARVCKYEDLFYLYKNTSLDASYNPYGMWLGDFVGDDTVLYGNANITFNGDSDYLNFEGTANKTDYRSYYCCHDRE